jgi:micrococcal nuclease
MTPNLYTYRAYVKAVYDGDSITCDIDLGCYVRLYDQKIRLLGINTPEIRGEQREQGLISRDRLREKILDKWVVIQTQKDKKGKYGRWLGTIWLEEENINEWLLTEGLAEVYGK